MNPSIAGLEATVARLERAASASSDCSAWILALLSLQTVIILL
jgi:hypothetical protein